jgi:Ca2+-binding EF-hand superfamily protein
VCAQSFRKSTLAGRGKGKGKPELTEEQKQEIREAFDLFDTDGSGMCCLLRLREWKLSGNDILF